MARPRIVVAEDNPEMRERFKGLLEADFDIVGSATDGQQAIDFILGHHPDILVTDISMPILNGIQVVSRLRALSNCVKVIFVTVHDDVDYREAAFSMSALGYVLKARVDTDLDPAVQGALQGKFLIAYASTADLVRVGVARTAHHHAPPPPNTTR